MDNNDNRDTGAVGFGMNTEESNSMYDEEPVYYCKRCLSLNIRAIPFVTDQDYCADCGIIDVGVATIEEWKEMYKKKYGRDYVEKRELKWPYWC